MEAGVSPDGEASGWFFQNALDVFVVLRDNCVVSANPAWYAFSGWTEAQTIGVSYWSFTHPDDIPSLQAHVADVIASGSGTFEHRCLTASGDWRWTRSRAKRTADGRTLLVVQDITAEREASDHAEKVSRVAELLGVTAGVYIWRFDAATKEYDLNPLKTDGAGGQRVAEATFRMAIHPEDRDQVNERWLKVLHSGEAGEIAYRHMDDAGRWRRYHTAWRGVRILPNGQWEVLGITQDVTELADARDAALAAADAKTQFLANVSHEIRTPMNGVLGVLHLLKADVLTPGARALVREALAAGSTLAQLLTDIVDFSKIERGRLDLTPEPMDVGREVEVVLGMVGADAEARGLTLAADCQGAAGWVALDPVRFRQMVFNLVGNALKFTLEGGVKVRAVTEGAGERKRLRIEVEDSGIGIGVEAQAHLFDRFHQGDGSSTRRFGGSGLGLAITKGLAEQMGGRIGFTSIEGEGSTFWFEISAPACRPSSGRAAGPWLSGLKVLVVEDNATNRLVATHLLQELGALVETAEDGSEGVARAAAEPYDLIFMDIQMPVMDGVQATRRIRAQPGPNARTPILAATANVLPPQLEAYLQAGMDGHVAKPISPAALLAEVARLSAGRGEEAAA